MLPAVSGPNENELIPIGKRANFNETVTIKAGVGLDDADISALKNHLAGFHNYRLSYLDQPVTVTDSYQFADSKFKTRTSLWRLNGSGRTSKQRKDRTLNGVELLGIRLAIARFLTDRLPAIWYFPNFLFDFPERIYLAEQQSDTDSDRFYRALLQDILDSLDLDASIDQHILRRARSDEPADLRALDQLLLVMGREVTEEVFVAWNRIFGRQVEKQWN